MVLVCSLSWRLGYLKRTDRQVFNDKMVSRTGLEVIGIRQKIDNDKMVSLCVGQDLGTHVWFHCVWGKIWEHMYGASVKYLNDPPSKGFNCKRGTLTCFHETIHIHIFPAKVTFYFYQHFSLSEPETILDYRSCSCRTESPQPESSVNGRKSNRYRKTIFTTQCILA